MKVNELDAATLRRLSGLRPERGKVLSLYLDLDPSTFATPAARATAITSLLDEAERKARSEDGDHEEKIALREDVERARDFFASGFSAKAAGSFATWSRTPSRPPSSSRPSRWRCATTTTSPATATSPPSCVSEPFPGRRRGYVLDVTLTERPPEEADRGQLAPEYGGLLAAFATIFSVGVVAARRRGRMPEHVRADDIALGSIATFKLARVLSKDRVTSPVRAPFTRGEGEEERPRGRGPRYVIGELFLCPFCLGQWIGAAYAMGLVFAPRVTRLIAAMMSVVALSDFLQLAYKGAENRRASG